MITSNRFSAVEESKSFKRIREVFDLKHKKVFDLGCGYGEYLALFGNGSIGITSNKEEVQEATSRGLSVFYGNLEELPKLTVNESFDVIWANNFFEHLLSPHQFLMNLKHFANDTTLLILGVPVFPKIVSLLWFSKFRGALASNHINFFTKETLITTVERAGWKVITTRPYFFNNKFLDTLAAYIAPHIFVVAKHDAAFMYSAKKMQEWRGVPYYESLLTITKQL